MKTSNKFFEVALLCWILSACSTATIVKSSPNAISVMAYNVENLFDTKQDSDREDYTSLPLSFKKGNRSHQLACEQMKNGYFQKQCFETDWNDKVLALKLSRLRDTILQIGGVGPDILMLEEVENLPVLHQLNQSLPEAQYQTEILIEGDDRRGIDVGLLSRLPLAGEPKLHRIEFTPDPKNPQWKQPLTRGILQVPLKLPNGDKLTVLGFHWPSQGAPVQERIDAVNALNKILDSLGPNEMVLSAGDSNITVKEDFKDGLHSKMLASRWQVSHLVGCSECEGTHYYRGEWSFLDIMLFSPALTESGKGSYKLQTNSIRTPKDGKYQLKINGTPARFNEKSSVGVSDHLPLYSELIRR